MKRQQPPRPHLRSKTLMRRMTRILCANRDDTAAALDSGKASEELAKGLRLLLASANVAINAVAALTPAAHAEMDAEAGFKPRSDRRCQTTKATRPRPRKN